MRCRVPVMFNAEVVHRGKRKAVSEAQVEWLEVAVKEATDLAAPLAAEWRSDGMTRRTRWHDGFHWLQHTIVDHDAGTEQHLSAEEMSRRLAAGIKEGNPLSVGVGHLLEELAAGQREEFDPEGTFFRVVSSDRDQVVAAAHKKAEDVLVVDGMVFVRSSEPVYVMRRALMERSPEGPVMRPSVVPLGSVEAGMHNHLFRADRFDDMREEARAGFGEKVTLAADARIDVYIPESVSFDDEKASLCAGIRDVLDIRRKYLPSAELPFVRCWLEAAEALDAAKADWNEETVVRLETAADTYVAVSTPDDPHFSGVMQRTLERWRMRPIGSSFDVGHRP